MYTHDSGLARSRLDRVYANHHVADHLDKIFTCTALPWTPLSAHRPLSFSRSTPRRKKGALMSMPRGPTRHPDWPRRVALEYNALLSEDTRCENPIRRLLLVKRAMHTVTSNMHRENLIAVSQGLDDHLGWTMACLRAAEACNIKRVEECVQAYAHLGSIIDPRDSNSRVTSGLIKLREHAVELAKNSITEKIGKLKRLQAANLDEATRTQLKEHILTRLKSI